MGSLLHHVSGADGWYKMKEHAIVLAEAGRAKIFEQTVVRN